MIDVSIKYAWVKLLTDGKAETGLEGFIGIINESKPKPNNLKVNQGREFCNNLMQNGLIYLTYNQSKLVVAERFTYLVNYISW